MCSKGPYDRITQNYLIDSKIVVTSSKQEVKMDLKKRCPQELVFGPTYGISYLTKLVKEMEEEYATITYTNGCIVLINGNWRKEVEERSMLEVKKIPATSEAKELVISKRKTRKALMRKDLPR